MPQPSFEPSPLAPRRSPEEQARDRDLGFGSVVSRESRERLLNRDGSFNVARQGLGFFETVAPYHLLLTISWTGFFGVVSLTYLVLNLVFAVAFVACGPEALLGPGATMLGGRFSQAFFFSIQTFARSLRRSAQTEWRPIRGPVELRRFMTGARHRLPARFYAACSSAALQPAPSSGRMNGQGLMPDREPAPERNLPAGGGCALQGGAA